jgi:hypothetical protein
VGMKDLSLKKRPLNDENIEENEKNMQKWL